MKRRHLDILRSDPKDDAVAEQRIDRRRALQFLAAGVTLTQAACSTSSPTSFGGDTEGGTDEGGSSGPLDCDAQPPGTDVGDVSSFANGTWSRVGSGRNPFIVGQDDSGVFAFTAICTHQGCEIGAPDATGKTTCPCHGAQFDGNGAVLRSPATRPLVHFAVAICSGHVFVDSSTTVDASTRTPVA